MVGALVPLLKDGERTREEHRRVRRDAGGVRKTEGTKNAVKLGGGYGRGVPVEDCIATTASMVRMGCDGEGGRCKKGRVWGAMKEG